MVKQLVLVSSDEARTRATELHFRKSVLAHVEPLLGLFGVECGGLTYREVLELGKQALNDEGTRVLLMRRLPQETFSIEYRPVTGYHGGPEDDPE